MAKNDNNFGLQLGYAACKELITNSILKQSPYLIMGSPGVGKSDMIREIASELKWEDSKGVMRPWVFIDIRLSLLESCDIKGYPHLQEITTEIEKTDSETGLKTIEKEISKVLAFAMNKELPRNVLSEPNMKWVVFIDEINGAHQSTQLAMYQLILDRAIGEYNLPNGASLVAAGNRDIDKGATSAMPKPLENRFGHVELLADFDSWFNYAIMKNVNPEIIGYLGKNRGKLNDFNPQDSSKAFGTPRSWIKTNYLIDGVKDENLMHNIVASQVGLLTAMEFMAFRKIADDIPSADDILDGKMPKLRKEGIDISYMLITNVMYRIKEMHNEENQKNKAKNNKTSKELSKKINNFFEYLIENEKLIGADFCVLPIKMLYNNYGIILSAADLPAVIKLVRNHGDLLTLVFEK